VREREREREREVKTKTKARNLYEKRESKQRRQSTIIHS
jgi:hypothetical protein